MSWHSNATPFLTQHALGIDQKGAAHDAKTLTTKHGLLLDDIKEPTDGFIGVRQQLKGQLLLGLEVGLRPQAVAGSADDHSTGLLEVGGEIAKILRLASAAGGAGLGVEVQHHLAATLLAEAKLAASGRDAEIRNGLIDGNGCHVMSCINLL